MKRIIEVAVCVGLFGASLVMANEVVLPPLPAPAVDPMLPVPFPDQPAPKTPYIPEGKVFTMPDEARPKGTVMTPAEQKKASPFLVPALPSQTSEPPMADADATKPATNAPPTTPAVVEPPLVIRQPSAGPIVAQPSGQLPAVSAPKIATPSVATPSVATPSVATPSVATPSVATPSVATPSVATPTLGAPEVVAPAAPAAPQLGTPIELPAESELPRALLLAPEAVDVAVQEPVATDGRGIFAGMEPLVSDDAQRILPRFSLRHDIGHGVGYRNGFTYVEGFLPFAQTPESVVFSDTRVVNFDHHARWEFNQGFGYRKYTSLDVVLGVNTFYDGRQNDGRYYNQMGIGFEALHASWEARLNGYFILGEQRKQISESSVLVPTGPNFNLVTTKVYGVAMSGMEAEVGGPLPWYERWYPRVYLGYYHYSGDGVRTLNGIRGRLEAQLTRGISLHFAAQNDPVFDTTVSGGLALHLGAGAFRNNNRGRPTLQDILGQRVVRDVNIVIDESTTTSNQFVPGAQQQPKDDCDEEEECDRHRGRGRGHDFGRGRGHDKHDD